MILNKYIFRLLLIIFSLLINPTLFAENKPTDKTVEPISGIGLNKNRFFRYNNNIQLSFNVSLQKGYDQYLEYIVRIADINKQEVNVILSLQQNSSSELLIISKDKLSKHNIGISKDEFLGNDIPFNFQIDLKNDQLAIGVKDTVVIESRLGLKPHTDYKVIIGAIDSYTKADPKGISSLRLTNLSSDPDLLDLDTNTDGGGSSALLWIIIIIVLDIIIFAYIIFRKRKRKKQRLKEEGLIENTDSEEEIVFHPEINDNDIAEIDKSAIFMFKQFEVLDKTGKDISSRFTPLLKELFLLLLLYSQKDNKGINTGVLKDILWFDKEQQSANNNRAVNIGKLKNILDTVGDYDIITTPYNIRLELKDNIYCDYVRLLSLLYNESLNKEQILELVTIAGRGSFLPECSYEWLDSFKAEISDKLIDNLIILADLPNIKEDNKLSVQIADTIFNQDNLNEKALSIKCIALVNMGKRSAANNCYNKFVKDYESIYQVQYPMSFAEISVIGKL